MSFPRKKIIYISPIILVLIVVGYFLFPKYSQPSPKTQLNKTPLEVTYEIEGASVRLTGAVKYFGNDATGDLNADGLIDTAFILTQDRGGSGTFYYVAVALRKPDGYVGTNAILLGDRIAPQTTEIRNGYLVVNYVDRKPSEPMVAQPSIGISKYFVIQNSKLSEISKPNGF